MKRLLFLFLLAVPFIASAQRFISGRVTNAEDSIPIHGASVFIDNTTVGTNTDLNGYYRFEIPGPGSYQLAVSHVFRMVLIEIKYLCLLWLTQMRFWGLVWRCL